jgi:hypothetical protein
MRKVNGIEKSEGLLFAGRERRRTAPRQTKMSLLCVLCASVVKKIFLGNSGLT